MTAVLLDRSLCDGRYRLERVLGRGPSGVVYLATEISTGERRVLKRLHAQFFDEGILSAIQSDLQAAALIEHPGIVAPSHIGRDEEACFYLVERAVLGGSLKSRLAAGPLSREETLRIFGAVCAALDAAHQKGLYHGDLTPENILCAAPGAEGPAAYVTDFGMHHLSRDRTTMWAGMVGYLAPEIYRGEERGATARADIFSLGAILYECLSGQRLFEGPTAAAVMFRICVSPLPTLSHVLHADASRLDALVEMACHRNAEARFERPLALWSALESILGERVVKPNAPEDLELPIVEAGSTPRSGLPVLGAPGATSVEAPPSPEDLWMNSPPGSDAALDEPWEGLRYRALTFWASIGGLVMGVFLLIILTLSMPVTRLTHVTLLASTRSDVAPAQPSGAPPLAPAQPATATQPAVWQDAAAGDDELRLGTVFQSFEKAAAQGEAEQALALYREIPAESSYRARGHEAYLRLREEFERAHIEIMQAAHRRAACDEVDRQLELLGKHPGDASASVLALGRRIATRCRRQEAERSAPRLGARGQKPGIVRPSRQTAQAPLPGLKNPFANW